MNPRFDYLEIVLETLNDFSIDTECADIFGIAAQVAEKSRYAKDRQTVERIAAAAVLFEAGDMNAAAVMERLIAQAA